MVDTLFYLFWVLFFPLSLSLSLFLSQYIYIYKYTYVYIYIYTKSELALLTHSFNLCMNANDIDLHWGFTQKSEIPVVAKQNVSTTHGSPCATFDLTHITADQMICSISQPRNSLLMLQLHSLRLAKEHTENGAPETCMFQLILCMKAIFLHVTCMKCYHHA